MSRSARAEPAPPECALAAEMFEHLCSAGTMKQTLALYREICTALNLRPNKLPDFYPKLKAKLSGSWKAQALYKKFDARANHKVYGKGRACAGTRVLIVGAGPCGLRAAIECQLLGAKVVVVEKRDRMSRNNVLHLWPFVIQDLKALGAKKFFGKFCAGSIDHISIRQLQCILLKVALFLGVEFHEGVSFEQLLEPTVTENSETLGWRARVSPADHPVAQYEFDALLGADGRRNTLPGFKRKEFRGKLAMAITANFINRHSEQEASVPEISGVAFIFNQKFFKDLYKETGIDLENIVYYKDDTHYFVMTAKKHSLLHKGVLLNDYNDVSRLLDVGNVDRGALMRYAQEAARFSTDARLPLRDFALNHYGEPDVALFDFTSMYAAENASMVYERLGRRLLCQLVGDSLLEPFWPTGSGCARGFLSALDAAWAVRAWGQAPAPHPLHVVAERESVYRLLAQTTPENLNRDFGGYTLDPGTRYPNLNRLAVSPHRVSSFYDSDDPLPLDAGAKKRRREAEVPEEVLLAWLGADAGGGGGAGAGGLRAAAAAPALAALLRRYRPDLLPDAHESVYNVLQQEFGIPVLATGSLRDVPDAKLRVYLMRVYSAFKGEVPHVHHQSDVFLQIKQSQQNEKQVRNTADHSLAMYSKAVDADKSHSSYRKKRRAMRTPQVSNDEDYIRRKIGKLDLNDISHLACLIEGHDQDTGDHSHKQQALHDEIRALLDEDEAPDPKMLRETLAQHLQGNSAPKPRQERTHRAKRSVTKAEQAAPNLDNFFSDATPKPIRPSRRLKGLDATSIKYPDLTHLFDDDSNDTDATIVQLKLPSAATKELTRSSSIDAPLQLKERRPSEVVDTQLRRSQSPLPRLPYGRSNSIGSPESAQNTRRIAEMFESHNRRHTPSADGRSGLVRSRHMTELTEGEPLPFVNPDRVRLDPNSDMAFRRQRVIDLIHGQKQNRSPGCDPAPKRKNTEDMSFRMQRASDQVQRRNAEPKKKSGGRRRAAREITRQRFEKSVQMLAAGPQMALAPATDLQHDVGLQQYRASAPHFGERVKKLEKQLQHYEEGRVITGGGRAGGGARVARLAAELAGTPPAAAPAAPRPSKPKDLMRSVGRIERDDWNVKEIEKKIMQNRLGRPEPRTAEKVPKWDREQFLGRQRRLREGDNEEKWGVIDETLHKLDQKLRDSGRPDHGTKKVANLANKFVTKEPEPEKAAVAPKEDQKKSWRGPSAAGMQCAACGTRVFAAESVTADGLHLHRACFRCAVCKAVLRPGNYTMERYGTRLVCLRHSGAAVRPTAEPDAPTPERISLEASDSGAREIDEDEWTDRNCLASETSGAGGLSDEEDSSSDEFTDADDSCGEEDAQPAAETCVRPRTHIYLSEDSFGYDDYSDDGGESSGNESCSRMHEAREARRREVPADARPPTDSSEVESEEESEESAPSSGTEVSTDSEFAREEPAAPPAPPAILVTEAPPPLPPPPPPPPAPLARTRSAGGLATKRALELKRKYLLGEPSPPAVRKSDSTSQLDTKLQAFRTNITEFQKMLHSAATCEQGPTVASAQVTTAVAKKPMPDIIKNLCDNAPVDLLKLDCTKEWREVPIAEEKSQAPETDSLSESSHSEMGPEQPVPRVEVHDEGGDLIQLDSLMIIPEPTEVPLEVAPPAQAESESSDSCRDVTTLALTDTELSDWAAESAVLDDFDENREDRKRSKNPRTLSGPKTIHNAKNLSTISSHVCGRTSPLQSIVYSNALEHFEFADEGEQDPSIGSPATPKNEGYMELIDDDYNVYSPVNDRSMNFIEGNFSETLFRLSLDAEPSSITPVPVADTKPPHFDDLTRSTDSESTVTRIEKPIVPELKSPQLLVTIESSESENSISKLSTPTADQCPMTSTIGSPITTLSCTKSTFSSLKSPTSSAKSTTSSSTDTKEPLSLNSPSLIKEVDTLVKIETPIRITIRKESVSEISPPLADTPVRTTFAAPAALKMYAPAICRSASANFTRSLSPTEGTTTDKVQEIKREREEQTDIVRKLVLERLGRAPRRSTRRCRASPVSGVPPPVPPPPALPPPADAPPPPPPPRPTPPLPVTPSLSDPELARDRRSKSIIRSLSSYFNRRLGPRTKEATPPAGLTKGAHKSTGALELPPPVPPPPARYRPPDAAASPSPSHLAAGAGTDADERDAMQLWFEARWARLVAARRARDHEPRSEPTARRLARLERRLARPLSAEQQAATVAELVQVSAQHGAHQALLAADDRRRSTASGSCE